MKRSASLLKNPFVAIWFCVVMLTMCVAAFSAVMSGTAVAGERPKVVAEEAEHGAASNEEEVEGGASNKAESGPATSEGHAEEEFSPIDEFALTPLGPAALSNPLRWGCDGKDADGHKTGCMVDMGINKAVVYLWLGALICCGFTVWQARKMQIKPTNTQTFTEVAYDFAYTTIAKATLGEKVFSRYMPYVASLFMFIWVVNMISFIPLPFGEHHAWGIRDLGLYAATSNINVTLALTLVTFVLSHYEGIRLNGPKKYFGSWAPSGVHPAMGAVIWVLHAMSEALRLVSLSVRLFANMLAGHLLILMMLGMIVITGIVWVAIGTVPIALFFFLFEFGLVATLQAFIFAMLSGIYIGFAAEPHH